MLLEKINNYTKEEGMFSDIARVIMNEITKNKHFNLSIVELAEMSECSQPSATRFIKNLEVETYKQFIKEINEEIENYFLTVKEPNTEIHADAFQMLSDLKETFEKINDKEFEKIAQKVISSNKINISAMGGNVTLKTEVEHKLSQIGKNILVGYDWHQQLINLHYMNENDLVIIISYSGDKYETLKVANAAKEKGVPILAITGYFDSQLLKIADYKMVSYSSDPKYRSFSLTGKVSALGLWDLLFKRILKYDVVKQDVIEAWRWQN